jgi:hypothetical protein
LVAYVAAFRRGLKKADFVNGQTNATIKYRWAEGHYDRLPALAADLVQQGHRHRRARGELLGVWRLVGRLWKFSNAGWFKLGGTPRLASLERRESTQDG